MKTIVILGTGTQQIPMIQKAKELGCYVVGLDGNDEAEGWKLCDYFDSCNIKDPDQVEYFITVFRARHKGQKIDGAISPAVEVGHSVGRLVDKYKLPGIGEHTAYRMTNKIERRRMLDELGILQPKWSTKKEGWDTFPCIIKPAMLSAAVGVKKINTKEELEKEEFDLVEEYLEGNELSVEVLIENNSYTWVIADRNYEYKKKYAPYIIENGCDLPSKVGIDTRVKISRIVNKLHTELPLFSCAIKLDLLVKDNKVYVLECPPRLGGGRLSSHMIQMYNGTDWWLQALKLALGYKLEQPVRQRYEIHENPKSNRDRGKDTIYYV